MGIQVSLAKSGSASGIGSNSRESCSTECCFPARREWDPPSLHSILATNTLKRCFGDVPIFRNNFVQQVSFPLDDVAVGR